jgi:hypothetical protein
MLWWRVSLQAGTVLWETSPGNSDWNSGTSDWTTQRTLSAGLPTLTSATLQLVVGHYSASDPDQPATFDDVLVR